MAFFYPHAAAISFALIAASFGAAAQDKLYQIELITFARTAVDLQEVFPKNLNLSYPLNTIELKDPNKIPEASTSETSFSQFQNNEIAASDIASTTNASEAVSIDLTRTPFYVLPTSELQLKAQADRLTRDGRYRLLTHLAWRQPLSTPNKPTTVFIDGGEAFGKHRELEGSIAFSLGQVAHVHPRIWLTQFAPFYGQAESEWPNLPLTPAQKRSQWEAPNVSPSTSLPSDAWSLTTSDESNTESADPYLPQRIVMVDEDVRVRLNENYYIDHPVLGIVVRITPYNGQSAIENTPNEDVNTVQ